MFTDSNNLLPKEIENCRIFYVKKRYKNSFAIDDTYDVNLYIYGDEYKNILECINKVGFTVHFYKHKIYIFHTNIKSTIEDPIAKSMMIELVLTSTQLKCIENTKMLVKTYGMDREFSPIVIIHLTDV